MGKQERIITAQDITEANSYVSLAEKTAFARAFAGVCIQAVKNVYDTEQPNGEYKIPMPDRYEENLFNKSLFLMSFFIGKYLKKYDRPFEALKPDEYDAWAGSAVFNQIERLKTDSKIRDKIYDMLADYKDFEKRLNTEIYSALSHKNDVTARLMLMIQQQTDPEQLSKATDALQTLTDEAKKRQEGGNE